jgi:SAM-dependent methyltransferase
MSKIVRNSSQAIAHARDPATRHALRFAARTVRRSRRRRAGGQSLRCPCCFGTSFEQSPTLWKELVETWELTPEEEQYIDRQQGLRCLECGSTMRSMALAHAVMEQLGPSLPFSALAFRHPLLRILEVNRAGQLTPFLCAFPRHVLAEYPEVDVHNLPYPANHFDVVLHSDTLEHVEDPGRALAECLRVARADGFVAFTVPLIYGRLTRSRSGLPPSFHGYEGNAQPDLRVETEFGADVWAQVLASGARSCSFSALEFPAGLAIVARPGASR